MFPTCSSGIFPSLSPASVEISERAAFIRTLEAWVAESPFEEQDSRNDFAKELKDAFDTNSAFFSFVGNISSLPACIGRLSGLQRLDLCSCEKLTFLPPEIGRLSYLQRLGLFDCTSLTSLPPEIGNLSALEFLFLCYCTSLTSLPPEIGKLSSLQKLSLADCTELTELPPEIGNLTSLRLLNLNNCRSLTSLPPETITFEDSHPLERQEFVEIFEKFLALFRRLHQRNYIQDESIASGSGGLQATGRFVKALKKSIIQKPFKAMQKELAKTHNAIESLQEDCQNHASFAPDDRGPPLPLIILACFIAEDARVHCLRLQQELENRLDQANLL